MEISGKDILVLGGWGLVGLATCRKLIEYKPNSITISSLVRKEAETACEDLASEAQGIKLYPAWGNIFVRSEFKDFGRDEILEDISHRLTLAEDILEPSTSFNHFYLYNLITETKPHIIIDCVNSATALAYQDVYSAGLIVQKELTSVRSGGDNNRLLDEVEKLLCSLYLPQLVRHVQVLYQAMKAADTKTYIKIGTSGTGGMGLNIPYTHSEDKPSRVLLSKTSVAGAHSLLLFIMGRTPDAPYTKEVKPATAIAWKSISSGEILRGGRPIPLFDCPIENAIDLSENLDTCNSNGCIELNRNLEGVFIDTGENGTFSPCEFTAITTSEQMEFITPEEIAQTVIWEIEGCATGHDIIGALDASILGPTYRAGVMRSLAIKKMKELVNENENDAVAFELLGPPRLSKLLYEAYLLKKICVSLNGILQVEPEIISEKIAKLIATDRHLRSNIISIGIPILLPDGKRLIKGPIVKVPHDPRKTVFNVNPADINKWSSNGWVDLRVSNMKLWRKRIRRLLQQTEKIKSSDTSSQFLRDTTFWRLDDPIDEGELVGWIFIEEEQGRRMK